MDEQNQKEYDENYIIPFEEGIDAYKAEDYLKSTDLFKTITQKFPNEPDGHINLGNSYFKLDKIDQAISCWKKAKELDRNIVTAYINLGNAYYQQNKVSDAVKEWENGLLISPNNQTILVNLGSTYEKAGRKKMAFRLYDFLLENSADTQSFDYQIIKKKLSTHKLEALHYMKKGVIYQKRKYYRNAVANYIRSVRAYPIFAKAYLNLGSVCYQLDKHQSAIEYWIESYKLDNQHVNLCLNLAISYDKLRKYVDSYCFFIRYIQKIGKNTVDVINAKHKIKKLEEIFAQTPKMIVEYREESEKMLEARDFAQAAIRYENLYILTKDEDVFVTLNKINTENDPIYKAAEFAFETGKKLQLDGKIQKSMESFKKCAELWPGSYLEQEANKKIIETGKLMGGAISALMKVHE